MRTSARLTLAVAALAAAGALSPLSPFANADDDRRGGGRLDITALTAQGQLVTISNRGSSQSRGVTVTGLDAPLIGIDYRVQDGALYGVSSGGGVFRIDPATGAATLVKQLTQKLNGTAFGVDFNPAANALRIVSNTGQNLRQPFADLTAATVADTPLSYVAGTPAVGIAGAAYTNNDLDADTATTLFDLDANLDQVALQSPANSGTLVATGKLGVLPADVVGFDIYSTLEDGQTVANEAYALLDDGRRTGLYEVDLLTGAADRTSSADGLVDLAIPTQQRRDRDRD